MPKPSHYKKADFYALHRYRYGWSVRLLRQGQRIERSFGDRAFGGEENALIHARRWRDQVVQQHPPVARRDRAMRAVGGNGPIPGVTFELNNDGRLKLWRAKTYVGPGKVLQKTFGAGRYGNQAMQMAIMERQRQLQAISGNCFVHPAEPGLRNAPLPRKPLPAVPQVLPANQIVRTTNTSGYPGVVRRGNHWTGQSTMGGKWVSQSFRIDRYGEEVALILAVWARLDQLREAGQ